MPDVRDIKAAALRQGWRCKHGKHERWYSPDGKTIVTTAVSPSAPAADRMLKQFKTGGLQWPS